ncbi:MAG: GntR family transcriptional regulator [Caulobacterales bacterium]|nr:GntR family transcriptional regulator [Caulobacterales bacterium]
MDETPTQMSEPMASDTALEEIRRGILHGRYAPAQRLRETDLIRELNLSRGPVREAMRVLAEEGLVRIEPRRGYVVTRPTRDTLRDVYELLEVVAEVAARRAARRVAEDASVAVRLSQTLKDLQDAVDQREIVEFMERSDAWREALETMGGNSVLRRVVSYLRLPMTQLQFRTLMRQRHIPEMFAGYRAITEAVLAGDETAAAAASRAHVQRAAELILSLPDSEFASTDD